MAVNYTSGNWTVTSQYTDTLASSPKNISVPDLDWNVDYVLTSDEPMEADIANITGSDLTSHEKVRFAKSTVGNVYTGTDIATANQLPSKKGVQVMAEVNAEYKCVNSVSGEEYQLPCKGRVVLRFPSHVAVTNALVKDVLVRAIASAFATKGSSSATGAGVDESRIVSMARGALVPEGL